ncbi:MFS general substrate transporter [Phlegmacium glaucopus]|nr:MFS general substrate transporter [Phlegmacium glaucopus]
MKDTTTNNGRGLSFWLVLLSLCLTLFLSALELTAVSTALPTIVSDLQGNDFVWVGVAYALTSSAILPLSGGIAQLFGRKPAVLIAIPLFALGSALCGAAQSMTMLIAGRAVQGLGGGLILSLASIILSDLVTLEERGAYQGVIGLTWCIAAAIGPVVGGKLSAEGQWRWLFYLNLPLCGVSAILAVLFLDVPTPPGTFKEKLLRMDWIGNFLIMASTTVITVGLTRGGVNAAWQSATILVLLIIGLVGLVGFFAYEALLAKFPLVPFLVISNRTSLSGYLQTFILPLTTIAATYYLPVYFQACKDASPIHSGVLLLGLGSMTPAVIVAGFSVKLTQRYRPQIWTGWVLQIIGMTLMTFINLDTPIALTVGFSIIFGVGAGLNYGSQIFPIQASLPVSATAHALAFYAFLRSFAGVWGVTLGGAILQNELKQLLPTEFTSQFPQGIEIIYSAIPQIPSLQEPLKTQVQEAFVQSLQLIWKVLAGLCGLGLLSTFLMEGLPLHSVTDEAWVMQKKEKVADGMGNP